MKNGTANSKPWCNRWRMAFSAAALSVLAACGGGSAGTSSQTQEKPGIQAEINSKIAMVDKVTLGSGLVTTAINKTGITTMTVKSSSDLSNLTENQVAYIPDRAVDGNGVFMKISKKQKDQNGNVVFVLQEPAPGEVFSSLKISTKSMQAGLQKAFNEAEVFTGTGVTLKKSLWGKIAKQIGILGVTEKWTQEDGSQKFTVALDVPIGASSPVKDKYKDNNIIEAGCRNLNKEKQDKAWVEEHCQEYAKLTGELNIKFKTPEVEADLQNSKNGEMEFSPEGEHAFDSSVDVDGNITLDILSAISSYGNNNASSSFSLFDALSIPSDEKLFQEVSGMGFGNSKSLVASRWSGLSAEDKKYKIPLAGIVVNVGPAIGVAWKSDSSVTAPMPLKFIATAYLGLDISATGAINTSINFEPTTIKATQKIVGGIPQPLERSVTDKNGNNKTGDIVFNAMAEGSASGFVGLFNDLDLLVANVRVVNFNLNAKTKIDVKVKGEYNHNFTTGKSSTKGCFSSGYGRGATVGFSFGSKISVSTNIPGWKKRSGEYGYFYQLNYPEKEDSTTPSTDWPYWSYTPLSKTYCNPVPKVTKIDGIINANGNFDWAIEGENLPEKLILSVVDNSPPCDGSFVSVINQPDLKEAPSTGNGYKKASFSCKMKTDWVPNSFSYAVTSDPDVNWSSDNKFYWEAPAVNATATISVSSLNPSVGEKFLIYIKDATIAIKKVVFDFGSGIEQTITKLVSYIPLVGGLSEAAELPNGYSTPGQKTVTATYKDANGNTVGESTTTITIQPAVAPAPPTVTQAAIQTGGAVLVSGTATPGLNVKITWPDSITTNLVANASDGTWSSTSSATTYTAGQTVSVVTYSNAGTSAVVSQAITGGAVTATGKLPDTGITPSQCYAPGSDALVSCTSKAAIDFNDKQDGMIGRDVSSSGGSDGKLGFSYSAVGNYTKEECVKDNITGLTWEGKPTTGTRAASATYTNWGDNRASDASAYVTAVNAAKLCGYSDWRLPTADELQSIVDYSVAYPGPTIDGTWFPNTQQYAYWTGTGYAGYSGYAWGVDFLNGNVNDYGYRGYDYRVRLVR